MFYVKNNYSMAEENSCFDSYVTVHKTRYSLFISNILLKTWYLKFSHIFQTSRTTRLGDFAELLNIKISNIELDHTLLLL